MFCLSIFIRTVLFHTSMLLWWASHARGYHRSEQNERENARSHVFVCMVHKRTPQQIHMDREFVPRTAVLGGGTGMLPYSVCVCVAASARLGRFCRTRKRSCCRGIVHFSHLLPSVYAVITVLCVVHYACDVEWATTASS